MGWLGKSQLLAATRRIPKKTEMQKKISKSNQIRNKEKISNFCKKIDQNVSRPFVPFVASLKAKIDPVDPSDGWAGVKIRQGNYKRPGRLLARPLLDTSFVLLPASIFPAHFVCKSQPSDPVAPGLHVAFSKKKTLGHSNPVCQCAALGRGRQQSGGGQATVRRPRRTMGRRKFAMRNVERPCCRAARFRFLRLSAAGPSPGSDPSRSSSEPSSGTSQAPSASSHSRAGASSPGEAPVGMAAVHKHLVGGLPPPPKSGFQESVSEKAGGAERRPFPGTSFCHSVCPGEWQRSEAKVLLQSSHSKDLCETDQDSWLALLIRLLYASLDLQKKLLGFDGVEHTRVRGPFSLVPTSLPLRGRGLGVDARVYAACPKPHFKPPGAKGNNHGKKKETSPT